MNCLEFRRALGADPNFRSAESLAHRAECAPCEQYAQEMLRLNGLIKRALDLPLPVQHSIPQSVPINQLTQQASNARIRFQPRVWAMAASALLVIGVVVGILSLGTPRESLAAEIVEHLAHEPNAMTPTQARVSAELLDGALRAKGLRLVQALNDVSYLQSCPIRGHIVPHLVVQTERGPVTVLLLTEETVRKTERFDEQQYHGMLVPMEHGAMAVIATDASVVEAVAQRVSAAIR